MTIFIKFWGVIAYIETRVEIIDAFAISTLGIVLEEEEVLRYFTRESSIRYANPKEVAGV